MPLPPVRSGPFRLRPGTGAGQRPSQRYGTSRMAAGLLLTVRCRFGDEGPNEPRATDLADGAPVERDDEKDPCGCEQSARDDHPCPREVELRDLRRREPHSGDRDEE